MNSRGLRIFEIIWLVFAIVTFIASIHSTAIRGWKSSLMMYGIFIISLLFYLYRRAGRKAAGK